MSNERKRLPGSEKLTRPEDISALSKYLGYIKKTQEEHTELDKDNLEVPGRTTGRIPEIQELPENKEVLDSVDKNGSLSNTRIDLDASRSIELEDSLQTLDAPQNPSLDSKIVGLENNGPKPDLETRRENLEITENIELEDDKINLEDNRTTELPDTKVDLEVSSNLSLEEKRLVLEGDTDKATVLDTHKEELDSNVSEIQLTDKIVGLDNITNQDILPDTKVDLEIESEEITLPTQATLIKDVPEVSINIQEGSSGEIPETKLEETKIELTSSEGGAKEEELETARIDLSTEKETDLDNTRLDIEAQETDRLDEARVNLKVNEDIELGEDRVGVTGEINDPELEQTIIKPGEEAVEISGLDNKRVDIKTSQEIELEGEKLNLSDIPEPTLDERKIDRGGENKEPSLSDYLDSLEDDRDPELGNTKLEIEKKEVSGLYNSVISGPEKKEIDLEDTRLDIEENKTKSLEDEKLELVDVEGVDSLYDTVLEAPQNPDHEGWSKKQLYDSIMTAPEDKKYEKALEMAGSLGPWGMKVASLISSVLSNDSVDPKTASWFDNELKNLLKQMGAMSEFSNEAELAGDESRKPRPDNTTEEVSELPSEKVERPVADNSTYVAGSGNPREEREYTLVEKLFGLYERPFNRDNNKQGYKTIPKYQLPSRGLLDTLNVNNYLRFGVEELFGLWDPKTMAERKVKTVLLNETLALLVIAREQLEKLTKGNRERLPGDGMGLIGDLASGGVSGALGNLKDNALSALQNTFAGVDGIDKTNPLNRPRTKLGVGGWVKEVTTGFDKGNSRQDKQGDGSMDWKQLGKNLGNNLVNALIGGLADMNKERDISFVETYLNNYATMLTLEDLCELSDPNQVNSIEALKEVLKASPYISNPSRFGTIEEGRYGTMSLDTNSYWEIIIEPFCHTSMNGGYSFLPSIEEINVINQSHFGVKTAYSKWLPAVNFELQKSKLTNKSLGLYDGEIVYPITSELSNELRMTIVDDQYKSWRTYFQKCADVSVYSSEAHQLQYYTDIASNTANALWDDTDWEEEISGNADAINASRSAHITVVDKTRPIVALYKNITFLIKIYILTPQYSTIKRFNLLCVLKDFEESYSGDIDAGGYDLNLSFSIVGENPPPDRAGDYEKKYNKKSLSNILGGKNPEKLNQPPKKKGGIIKLL